MSDEKWGRVERAYDETDAEFRHRLWTTACKRVRDYEDTVSMFARTGLPGHKDAWLAERDELRMRVAFAEYMIGLGAFPGGWPTRAPETPVVRMLVTVACRDPEAYEAAYRIDEDETLAEHWRSYWDERTIGDALGRVMAADYAEITVTEVR